MFPCTLCCQCGVNVPYYNCICPVSPFMYFWCSQILYICIVLCFMNFLFVLPLSLSAATPTLLSPFTPSLALEMSLLQATMGLGLIFQSILLLFGEFSPFRIIIAMSTLIQVLLFWLLCISSVSSFSLVFLSAIWWVFQCVSALHFYSC